MPTSLGGPVGPLLPAATVDVVRRVNYFVVENPKSARAFLNWWQVAVRARVKSSISTSERDVATNRYALKTRDLVQPG